MTIRFRSICVTALVVFSALSWPAPVRADFESARLAENAGDYEKAAELYRKSANRVCDTPKHGSPAKPI